MKAFELSGFMTTDEANYHNAKKEELRSKDRQIEILRQELKNKSALLKMCGEALVLGREKVQRWVNEIYDTGGVEYIGLGSTLDKIDKALAALREAGVLE